jgi:hypothetical protein
VKLDQSTFEQTARTVFIMNETMREEYGCWQDIESYMTSMAYGMKPDCTFTGTGGFYLTAFNGADGRTVTATIMPFMALEYLKRLQSLAGI